MSHFAIVPFTVDVKGSSDSGDRRQISKFVSELDGHVTASAGLGSNRVSATAEKNSRGSKDCRDSVWGLRTQWAASDVSSGSPLKENVENCKDLGN